MIYLGIDTSNYTTSVAAIDNDRVLSKRELIPVREGERGIRQSDGVFQHIKILPKLYSLLAEELSLCDIAAVGVSERPRNVEGSYMPVFMAGLGFAQVIADTLGVPLYRFSHQDGHVMAGILSAECETLLESEFLSVHISGGTTEILRSRFNGDNFLYEIIGGTRDISAGQLIDRVGVKIGLRFPAGKELERISKTALKAAKLPVSVDGAYMNFSGAEMRAFSMLETEDNVSVALGVLETVGNSLVRAVGNAVKSTGIKKVLIAGGVASNSIIRKMLEDGIDGDVFFASAELSSDNAVGTAQLAKINYLKNQER